EPTPDIKQSLRHEAATRRGAAHAARSDTAGKALTDRFLDVFADALSGNVVSLYWPMRDEIDVRILMAALAAAGAQTAPPVMAGPDAALVFRAWRTGAAL
ncbi:unnamed protein product, partial [Laminaria digitata]